MGSLADKADAGVVQDVLVPWVVKPGPGEGKKKANGNGRMRGRGNGANGGEENANGKVNGNGNGRVAPTPEPQPVVNVNADDKVFNRYYHLFVKGELRDLVKTAARSEGFRLDDEKTAGEKYLRIVNEGWEADNWWIEGEVGIAA